jgi:arginine decarboxylase
MNWEKIWSPNEYSLPRGSVSIGNVSLLSSWRCVTPASQHRIWCESHRFSQGLKYLSPGEVVFAVVAENSTREPHRLLASSIGVAIPADRNTYGYLSEHHSFGETDNAAGDYAEELAAEMLATTLNVEFDPDRSWDEKKEIYRISNKIVRTANVTQSAVGDKRALWTTVIASAVLIFD